MKRLRRLLGLALLIPAALPGWLLLTTGGLQWVTEQVRPWLPGELELESVSGRLAGTVTLTGVTWRQPGVVLQATRLELDWQPTALLTGNINIDRVSVRALVVDLDDSGSAEQAATASGPFTLPDIRLPWLMILDEASIDGLVIRRGEQRIDLDRVSLSAASLFNKLNIDHLAIDGGRYSVNIAGKLKPAGDYDHDLEFGWCAELPSGETVSARGSLAGDIERTRVRQRLSGPLDLTLDGELRDLLDAFSWQAGIEVARFDLSRLDAGWPALRGSLELDSSGDAATATLSGKLDGEYPDAGTLASSFRLRRVQDGSIHIEQLAVDADTSGTRIAARGTWRPGAGGGDVQLSLDWQDLRWPLTGTPWFDSARGSGSVEGSIDRYHLELSSDSPWPDLVPSSWTAVADGDAHGLDVHALRVRALDGEARAQGRLDWSPALSWQARVTAADIDPAVLWPQWPGRLEAAVESHGRVERGRLVAVADITRIEGRLRDYPVSLTSSLAWRDDGLDITRLDISSGGSTLAVEGRAADMLQLDWKIDAGELAALHPRAGGRLLASGSLTGPRLAPTVRAKFDGASLEFSGYRAGVIAGTLDVDLSQWQRLDINLAAQALQLDGYSLKSLDIDTSGDTITVQADSAGHSASIELQGKADEQGWRGRVMRADLVSQQYGDWELGRTATLGFTTDSLQAGPLCWRSTDSELCMAVDGHGDDWTTQADARQLPLMLFAPWLPAELKLEGRADASVELAHTYPDTLHGRVDIELPAGVLSYPLLEGERDRWEYLGGTVTIKLDAQGVVAAASIDVNADDRIRLKAELPGASLLALDQQRQPLRANAQLVVQDLGLVEALVPEVQDVKGKVALDIAASGTLARPRLSGRAHLLEGEFRIPRLGLNIEQFSLVSQSRDFGDISFRLDARSGEGELAIEGVTTLDRAAGWPTELSVKGRDFEVARIPEARAQVSPDLQVRLRQRRIDIEGEVHVPYARLQPKDISSAARVSNDVIIIGEAQTPDENWMLHTKVRLTLGERVSFYGFGFEGRLGGSLLLQEEPGQLSRATGEINIPEGRYRAYGQRLDVENGRLLYTGGPLSNPGLDVRAVRRVGDVTAGIMVKGSLNQPRLELFAIPAMGQTDALAYLLLGGPIEKASGEQGAMMAKAALALGLSGGDSLARSLGDRFGLDEMRVETSDTGDQASLVVGRYLSPRLYVGYGVGLIESINTLTLRYTLTDKWQLKAESGEYHSADILYTIER